MISRSLSTATAWWLFGLCVVPTATAALSLEGRVIDTCGVGLPGTSIKFQNEHMADRLEVFANGDGYFFVEDLDPGKLSIEVALDGFKGVRVIFPFTSDLALRVPLEIDEDFEIIVSGSNHPLALGRRQNQRLPIRDDHRMLELGAEVALGSQ